MLFLATARVIYSTEHAPKPKEALDVIVIGHQFWWEYRYPKLGIVTANELHIPVSDPSDPTPTYLTMSSADTNHSFWIPRLAGKMDLIPNKVNTMWIDPATAGLYLGQCAQYCGTQHAKMLLRVYADTPAEFAAWVAHQQQPASRMIAATSEGRDVFQHNACISCHTICRHGRYGKIRPRPDTSRQPGHDRFGRRTQYIREYSRLCQRSRALQAWSAYAPDASQRSRSRRRDRISHDAEVALKASEVWQRKLR